MPETTYSDSKEKGAFKAPFLVSSHAKLNLSLRVYSPRKDGYHPICSVFQEISLHDTLKITIQEPGCFSVSTPGASINGTPNILEKVFNRLSPKLQHGYHVEIDKQIPIGGGLGGGSANAGTFLKWLNHTEQLQLPYIQLSKIALSIGADVPFFLTGGRALVRGIGEKIRPLPPQPTRWYVLINPNQHLSTPAIFRALDAAGITRSSGKTPHSILNGVIGENTFKPIVWQMIPELLLLEAQISQTWGKELCLSGSGATVFIECDTQSQATHIQNSLIQSNFGHFWIQIAASTH